MSAQRNRYRPLEADALTKCLYVSFNRLKVLRDASATCSPGGRLCGKESHYAAVGAAALRDEALPSMIWSVLRVQ